jgi:hypothetical protein
VVSKHKLKERASMGEVSIIGVDLAKNVFQLRGAQQTARSLIDVSGGDRLGHEAAPVGHSGQSVSCSTAPAST